MTLKKLKIAPVTGASSGTGQATAARPELRYAPGLTKRMRLLRRFAPASMLDAGVRKDLRLTA